MVVVNCSFAGSCVCYTPYGCELLVNCAILQCVMECKFVNDALWLGLH